MQFCIKNNPTLNWCIFITNIFLHAIIYIYSHFLITNRSASQSKDTKERRSCFEQLQVYMPTHI